MSENDPSFSLGNASFLGLFERGGIGVRIGYIWNLAGEAGMQMGCLPEGRKEDCTDEEQGGAEAQTVQERWFAGEDKLLRIVGTYSAFTATMILLVFLFIYINR